MDVRKISETFHVTGQLTPDEIRQAAKDGYKTIINNRPDGEGGPEQPTAAACREAAEEAGLAYYHIPMTPDRLSMEMIEEFRRAVEEQPGPVLAHCKSGGRSTTLWALVECCHNARDVDEVLARAAAEGYDLSQMRPLLQDYVARAHG